MRLVEIRTDVNGKQYVALQGQSDAEAKEMGRTFCEERDRMAAEIFRKALEAID